jgi:hypothetical protein
VNTTGLITEADNLENRTQTTGDKHHKSLIFLDHPTMPDPDNATNQTAKPAMLGFPA